MSGELLKRKRNTLRVTGAEELREHQPMIANCCWECGRSSVKQNADVPVGRPPVKPLLILTNPRRPGPGGTGGGRGGPRGPGGPPHFLVERLIPIGWATRVNYSLRSARSGSSPAARRAGT